MYKFRALAYSIIVSVILTTMKFAQADGGLICVPGTFDDAGNLTSLQAALVAPILIISGGQVSLYSVKDPEMLKLNWKRDQNFDLAWVNQISHPVDATDLLSTGTLEFTTSIDQLAAAVDTTLTLSPDERTGSAVLSAWILMGLQQTTQTLDLQCSQGI